MKKIILISFGLFLLFLVSFNNQSIIYAASWPNNLSFPRIQSRHHWGYSSVFNFDPVRFSRFDYLGFTTVPLTSTGEPVVNFTEELLNFNPNAKTRIYVNPNNTDQDSTFPGHYLFYTGGKLLEDINSTTTSIKVSNPENFKAGYDAMFWDFTNIPDAEHIRINSVNGNVLSVTRGEKGKSASPSFSPVRSHTKNTYLSIHVAKGGDNHDWYPNWALLCKNGSEKECGKDYRNYADYKTPIFINSMLQSKTEGLKIDNAFGPFIKPDENYSKINLDINNDGITDGGYLNGKNLWEDGLLSLYKRLREGLPNSLIHGNGANVNPYLNGKLYQGWDDNLRVNWSKTLKDYESAMKNFHEPQFILADSEAVPNDYQKVRFSIAATLLGDGFYGNKGALGGTAHGPDTWYDEYDNGAGSSLIKRVNMSQNYLEIYPGTGNKFKIGDEIYLSEENMKITDIQGDKLIVQRAYISPLLDSINKKMISAGYNASTSPIDHAVGEKVYTMDQIKNTKGYLGKPLTAQNSKCSESDLTSCVRYFTNGVSVVNPTSQTKTFPINGKFYRINGTQDRSVNNGNIVENSITIKGFDGIILVNKNSGTPTPSGKSAADANNDGIVDGLDYVIWLNNYGKSLSGKRNGDFNNDTNIDGLDYVVWLNETQ